MFALLVSRANYHSGDYDFMSGLPKTLHSFHLIQRAVRKEEQQHPGYISQ
jgi:hypothetical protein